VRSSILRQEAGSARLVNPVIARSFSRPGLALLRRPSQYCAAEVQIHDTLRSAPKSLSASTL